MLNSRWFLEITSDTEVNMHALEEVIYSSRTKYQKLEILRLGRFGKSLILDGKMQSAEADEFIYHECLVHPVLLAHGDPRNVLIAGGGEGATIREVLRWPTVEKVYMVDLDREVVEVCKQYMPEWHKGAFNDSRVKVFYEDARKFIAEASEKFDVIILDLPEPMEAGPAIMLYTEEFYKEVANHLAPGGVMVTQATTVSIINCDAFAIIYKTISEVFKIVRPYWTAVPSFYTPWGFVFASDGKDPKGLDTREIKERLTKIDGSLKFYNPEIHLALFAIPEYLKDILEKETRVNRDSSPISFY